MLTIMMSIYFFKQFKIVFETQICLSQVSLTDQRITTCPCKTKPISEENKDHLKECDHTIRSLETMAILLHQVSLVENLDHQVMKEHWHYTSAIMPGQQLYCFPQVSGHSAVHRNGNSHSEYTTSLRTGVKDKSAEVRVTSTVLDQLLWKRFLCLPFLLSLRLFKLKWSRDIQQNENV